MLRIDVGHWLRSLGLECYAQAFADNHLDAEALPLLTDEDLRELGVGSIGHRKKLLHAIARLAAGGTQMAPVATGWDMGERRMVTVLFCDMADFTRLTLARDPEEIRDLLNQYFEIVDSVVQRYGGHVDKHIGDAVMAVFGAPVAHANDPERAVRAALDIHREVCSLRPAIRVHSGIASGPVVASPTGSHRHRQYTMIGSAVNLAARLQDLAASGEILIAGTVHRAVARWVECTPIEEVSLKGIDEPGQIWRIERLRAELPGDPQRTALVGRHAEIDLFAERLAVCRARGKGSVVHICAEAGLGKTRLVEEFRAMAEFRGFGHHTGLVLDFGDGGGQGAIHDLARSLLRLTRSSTAAQREQAIRRVLERGMLGAHREVYLNDLLDLPQPGRQRALYDAMPHEVRSQGKHETLAELVIQRAARQPQLLIVEDVHWADAAVLGYIHHLARAIADSPVILLTTTRLEGDPVAELGSEPGLSIAVIRLSPLQPEQALELAGKLVDGDARLIASCVERAGGNPLFLEHLLRNAGDAGPEVLPDSLQSLVQARIDNLDPRDKRALQAASVMGQRFTLAALRYLLDDPTYTCDRLVVNHLIRPVGDEYLFSHALVLEGVYSSLLRSWRRSLHGKAAAWFGDKDPILRAEQLARAEAPEAPQAYLDAALEQVSEYRFDRALQLVERGLALAPGHGTRYALACARADILRDLGAVADSIAAFEHALALASDDVERCRAWIGLAQGMRILDRTDEALRVIDRAEEVATRHARIEELATIHYLRGSLLFPRGDLDGCLAQHQKACDYARRVRSPEREARVLGGLGDAYYLRSWMISAHAHYTCCIELCREHGLGSIEVANLPMRGITRFYQNDVYGAMRDCAEAIVSAVQVGNKRAEILARNELGVVLAEMGRIEDAREELEATLCRAQSLGTRRFELSALGLLGKLMIMEGRRAEARVLLDRSLVLARETDFSFMGPMTLALVALSSDDPGAQRRALDEGERWLRSGSAGHNHLYFYRDAMDVALRAGDPDSLERYAGALEEHTRGEMLPWSQLFIARGRALAAYLRGARGEEVLASLRQLHEQTRRVGLHPAALALDEALASAA